MAVCKCKRMAKLMSALGAKQAAAMHGKIGAQWTARQWLIHFREEEDYIFPAMLRLGMVSQVQRLGEEHNRFRDQIRRTGKVNETQINAHAKLEDEYVLALEPYLPRLQQERSIAIARR